MSWNGAVKIHWLSLTLEDRMNPVLYHIGSDFLKSHGHYLEIRCRSKGCYALSYWKCLWVILLCVWVDAKMDGVHRNTIAWNRYTACRLCSLLPAICLDVGFFFNAFCPSRRLLSNFEIYTINIMIPMFINQVLKCIYPSKKIKDCFFTDMSKKSY